MGRNKNKNKKKNKFKNVFTRNRSWIDGPDSPLTGEITELFFPYEIWRKIMGFTKQAVGEISGFAKTERHGDAIIVEDFSIFTQECNPAHTTLSSEDLTQMYVGVAKAGGEPEKWNLWWHSHVNMQTSFSSTDDTTMKEISSNGGFIVGICTNKRNEYTTAVYKNGVKVAEDLIVRIVPEYTDAFLDELDDEIREKVTMTRFAPVRGMSRYFDDYDFVDTDLIPDYPSLITFGDGIPLEPLNDSSMADAVRERLLNKENESND